MDPNQEETIDGNLRVDMKDAEETNTVPKDVNANNGSEVESMTETDMTEKVEELSDLVESVANLAIQSDQDLNQYPNQYQPTSSSSSSSSLMTALQLDPTNLDLHPNEVLATIGSYIALSDLMNCIPRLSSKWNWLQLLVSGRKTAFIVFADKDKSITQALLKVFVKYSGLRLVSQPIYDTIVSKNHQLVEEQRAPVLKLAKQKFPNITSLSLMCFHVNSANEPYYVKLLRQWPDLTELKLISCKFVCEANLEFVYKSINRFTKLKHLTLFSRLENEHFDGNRLHMLAQLESLYLGTITVPFARLKSIRRLGIWHMVGSEWIGQLESMESEVANKLTHLTIFPGIDQLNESYLEMVSAKFPELKYLHVRTRLPLGKVFGPLTKLTKLKHLRLWHYQGQFHRVSDIDQSELATLAPLESVELLHLYIRLCTHIQLDWISHLFPNLKWIKFDCFRSKCSECSGTQQKKQCEEQMLKPLKKCTQLCRVYLDRTGLALERDSPIEHLPNAFQELTPDQLGE